MLQGDLFGAPEVVARPAGLRCVSLWQPWASLIAVGAKCTETRSWPAPSSIMGGRIGIHAAKTRKGMEIAREDARLWKECLKVLPWAESGMLPFGALVAVVTVEACFPVERLEPDVFGDYTKGRFGWMLTEITMLERPVPMRGAQGIFTVEPEGAEWS